MLIEFRKKIWFGAKTHLFSDLSATKSSFVVLPYLCHELNALCLSTSIQTLAEPFFGKVIVLFYSVIFPLVGCGVDYKYGQCLQKRRTYQNK
jgi:hypothetical protein